MKKKAALFDTLEDKKVRCNVCARRCVIKSGERGNCDTRINEEGTLYSLVYGSLISKGSIDPIEKKPLYNYFPGHGIYSIATIGCNFHCKMCQNWSISQCMPNDDGSVAICEDKGYKGRSYSLLQTSPENLIENVEKANCGLIAFTYNEPTIWHEFVMDAGKRAHERGIKNVLVTNGYSTPEASDELVTVIDAANIDFKAFNDDFYKKIVSVPNMKPVLNTAKHWKSHGIHIEITNLIIPQENDDPNEIRKMCEWIYDNLDPYTPIHFSAFHPDYKMQEKKITSASTLENAYNIAKNVGLYYVYTGNLRTNSGNNTFCPKCNTVLIERAGYSINKISLDKDRYCQTCGFDTKIIGKGKLRKNLDFK